MLIVFIAMTMRSASILSDPVTSATTIIPLLAFYAVILAVGAGLGRLLLSDELGISLVYVTSMRNLSIAVAIVVASDSLPTEAVLPIALAYIIQPPLGAVYMHYRRDVVEEGLSIRQAVAAMI
jgi:predicted Na+-dependent transporter